MKSKDNAPAQVEDASRNRLYQEIARELSARIAGGTYKVGERMPTERELSVEFDVSRPTIREAMIALEVQGLVDIRLGSGTYVKRKARGTTAEADFAVTAFELTEARLMYEGETAALAATHITDAELTELTRLAADMERSKTLARAEAKDHEFHLAIARATRNVAVVCTVENLWRLRQSSPAAALLHDKARKAKVKPVTSEHTAIIDALRSRDPAKARAAMRAHLGAVIEHLLFTTEEQAIQRAREEVQSTRRRFGRSLTI